ncbi:hypothetical protein PybrP1_010903 [[Pythium] brassicae (nom. inval.)]|nr:hypothetical protein PybrP1_010903 [[Pythium] brassicae (nom. inval.)]
MYIGPWQEYRLAKLQDDAIQRLRSEWEQQLREQIPESDDARIRELMQPMLAKLPSLLLASKSKRKKKVKKKATPPLSALEEVQRRKRMFAKWVKTAATADVSAAPATEWDFLRPYEPSRDPECEAVTPPDLEDSLDEDEVNNLLDWTDTLVSPGTMDEFPLLDEDPDALGVT